MTDIEKSLLNAWRPSSEIYQQRTRAMDSRTLRDGDILGAGFTHGNGEGSLTETWAERNQRRNREAMAAKAAELVKPQHVPRNVTVGLISREVAIAKGLTRYFTGTKCVRGHIAERLTSTRTCVECHRLHQLSSKLERGREARRLARAEGKSRYFSEQKCLRGHVSERSVATGKCIRCQNEDMAKSRHKRVVQ